MHFFDIKKISQTLIYQGLERFLSFKSVKFEIIWQNLSICQAFMKKKLHKNIKKFLKIQKNRVMCYNKLRKEGYK